MAMFAVVRQQPVPASLEATWRLVTEAPLVSEWFADCRRLAPGEPFRFDFGDGDFFAGRVMAWEAPHHLALTWRFMDVGPSFTIEYDLEENAGGEDGAGTLVTVHDTGSVTRGEAEGLAEGWTDFLARLAERARTGAPSRYRWSPSIGTAAIVAAPLSSTAAIVGHGDWWRAAFPGADVDVLERGAARIVARVAEPGWHGVTTGAALDLLPHGDATYVGIVHGGWDALPAATQVGERRRYAERWAGALKDLEVSPPQKVAAASPAH